MKRIIAMVLLVTILLGLVGCRKSDKADQDAYKGTFRAGFSAKLINPKESVPLAGYGRTASRMSQNLTEDLYVQCTALTDEKENTILIFAVDAIKTDDYMVVGRSAIAAELGIPVENIVVNSSHSHSSPDGTNTTVASSARYAQYVQEQMIAAAKEAMADRLPAQMYYGSTETSGLSFIRHYLMDDGSYGGDSFGDWDNHYAVAHTADPDTTMHLLKFTRDGGKDIVLVNWRAHAAMTGGAGKALNVSSDFLGPFRDTLQDMADCYAVYLQGHAGNINPGSRMTEEVEYADYREHGALLAEFAYEAMQDMKQLKTGELKAKQMILEAKIDHTMDHLYAKAAELSAIWNTTGDREMVIEIGKPYGIRSPYHANAIKNNYKRGQSQEIPICTLAIGDSVCFTAAPAELFDRNSMALEETSPYEYTLCLAYSNGHEGYIPAQYVWEYTSYETDITKFEPGTAELIQDTMLAMLKDMKES